MTARWRAVDLDAAAPAAVVVVVDVLRAFTFEPWAVERGATRILTADDADRALAIGATLAPDVVTAGELGGRPIPGFDLGNSPTSLQERDLSGLTLVHRTSAGTQGLTRTVGSDLVLAASFVNVSATVAFLRAHAAAQGRAPDDVVLVVTGASLGRDGDEDLACAELIGRRLAGEEPDPAPLLARVAASDAGRLFAADGPDWAPPSDLELSCQLDRFDMALVATPAPDHDAVEVTPR